MTFSYTHKLLAGTLALVLAAGMTVPAFAGSTVCSTGEVFANNICHPCVTSDSVSSSVYCIDVDNDQVADSIDLCIPTPPNQGPSDVDGCTDLDDDGVKGFVDQCLMTPPAALVDQFGCAIPDTPVAGELLSLNSSTLVIGGLVSSAIWMIPAVAGIAGAGIYLVKSRANRD